MRVLETRIGLTLLHAHFPHAAFLRDIPPEAPLATLLPLTITVNELQRRCTPETFAALFQDQSLTADRVLRILPRCRHVLQENRRVLASCEALKAGAMARVGELMTASYLSVRDDFEASCPELDALLGSALRVPGTLGARIAGAGWGGCAVALVETDAIAAFQARVSQEYREQIGLETDIFFCTPGQGAGVVLV